MKKLLLVMLFVFTNITSAQDTTQGELKSQSIFTRAKSSLADQTILWGSVAIIAGGCFVGRKQLGGLVWVTKKHFDKKISELVVAVHGVRTDIMQTKVHLHSRIEILGRDFKDSLEGVNSKLDMQTKQLTDLQESVSNTASDVKVLRGQIGLLQEDVFEAHNKLDSLQASANSLRAEIGAVASDVKSLHAKFDVLERYFISKKA